MRSQLLAIYFRGRGGCCLLVAPSTICFSVLFPLYLTAEYFSTLVLSTYSLSTTRTVIIAHRRTSGRSNELGFRGVWGRGGRRETPDTTLDLKHLET